MQLHFLIIPREVVVSLCTSAKDSDVKTIALFSLVMYKTLGGISTQASELLYSLLADEKDNLINSKKPSDQVIICRERS